MHHENQSFFKDCRESVTLLQSRDSVYFVKFEQNMKMLCVIVVLCIVLSHTTARRK